MSNEESKFMGKPLDLTGQVFGKLTAIRLGEPGVNTYGKPIRKWICKCDCGNETIVVASKLTGNHTSSCGCLQKEICGDMFRTHGLRKTSEYESWASMKDRCLNKNNKKFHLWGGRGITICDRWLNSFENFYADMGKKPDGCTLDRIDVNGNYEPENCRWATAKQQSNNLRTTKKYEAFGIVDTLSGFAERLGCTRDAIKLRLKRGQTMEYIYTVFKSNN